jgi:uncharacterized protein YbjT (DUF2867 family)
MTTSADRKSAWRVAGIVLVLLIGSCSTIQKRLFVLSFSPQSQNIIPRTSRWNLDHESLHTFAKEHARTYLWASNSGDEDKAPQNEEASKNLPKRKKKKKPGSRAGEPSLDDRKKNKEELVKEIGERMRDKNKKPIGETHDNSNSLLDKLNPFKAGQNLRKQLDTAITSISSVAKTEKRTMYYLDDRLVDGTNVFSERTLERLDQDDFVPEVLVVGATGEVGRLVVRRLLLDGRFRVRVLVRDLYTKTLNMLGTGVTYCQGDLGNMDSLEYALTDVDKIVFCASAPRPDEDQFQQRFQDFMKETLESRDDSIKDIFDSKANDVEWEQLESVLELRARLAEQVDCLGMQNLVRAYQHVRHADYGTSQAAKRSLFKFQSRPDDFNLFALDDVGDDFSETAEGERKDYTSNYSYNEEDYDEDDDMDEGEYEDEYADYDEEYDTVGLEKRQDSSVKTQVQWIRNKFRHAVFVGRVPKATSGNAGGEAAITSSRLRAREDPDNGIDLSNGFAGFICRVCSDGGTYEAFVRTRAFYTDGIEYVCQFSTSTKPIGRNKSKNKFVTVRLPFENFTPVRTASSKLVGQDESIPQFRGGDVRNIGFRYRSSGNELKNKLEQSERNSFYLAFSYIKLYRAQPEPEFVYLSDARIPPVVPNGMVRHEARQLLAANGNESSTGSYQILSDSALWSSTRDKTSRSPEETYYKYRGEEILKQSGLSYSIVRVCGFNESPSGEASTIDLQSSTNDLSAVSRDDVARVCVSALLDPNALNKSFYMGKKKGQKSSSEDEDMASKFGQLSADAIV